MPASLQIAPSVYDETHTCLFRAQSTRQVVRKTTILSCESRIFSCCHPTEVPTIMRKRSSAETPTLFCRPGKGATVTVLGLPRLTKGRDRDLWFQDAEPEAGRLVSEQREQFAIGNYADGMDSMEWYCPRVFQSCLGRLTTPHQEVRDHQVEAEEASL